MEFEFSEEQEMFRQAARDFLEKECPMTLVREIEDNKTDYSPEVYRKIADLGWLGLMIPEKYGGSGGDWVDMAILSEEMGRSLLQGPAYSTPVLSGQAILSFGAEQQQEELLPYILQGKHIYAFCAAEPDLISNLPDISTIARRNGNGYLISGNKSFVSDANIAGDYLVLAKTEDGGPGLFIVDKANPGLSVTHFGSISGERISDVNLVNVEVPAGSRLAESITWDAVEELLDKARLISCASGLGGAKSSLDMMVEYAKQRVIFGHPIGAYQSIQHNIADMALAIESAGALIYSAAWMSSNDIPCIKERAFAQLYCKKVFTRIAEQVTHCHGTVALCKDHNMTLYFRKAKATQLSLNHADSYCAVITRGMGL